MIINKKWVILVIILIVGMIIGLAVALSGNKKEDETQETLKLNNIEFTNITKEYDEGITTIRAEAKNNTEETKSVNVKITLKDAEGNVMIEVEQYLENIEPGKKKLLATGITGDYSNATVELTEKK